MPWLGGFMFVLILSSTIPGVDIALLEWSILSKWMQILYTCKPATNSSFRQAIELYLLYLIHDKYFATMILF